MKPSRQDDPELEALDRLVETIYRYRRSRLRIGVESVGFQRIIRGLLLRDLRCDRTTCCYARAGEPKKKWCRSHRPDAILHSAGIPETSIIPIPRSREEGKKEGYIRESLSPLIADNSILLGTNAPGSEQMALSLDIFPIRVTDLADALAMQLVLLEGRAPASTGERTRRRRLGRLKREQRIRNRGITGYGKWE